MSVLRHWSASLKCCVSIMIQFLEDLFIDRNFFTVYNFFTIAARNSWKMWMFTNKVYTNMKLHTATYSIVGIAESKQWYRRERGYQLLAETNLTVKNWGTELQSGLIVILQSYSDLPPEPCLNLESALCSFKPSQVTFCLHVCTDLYSNEFMWTFYPKCNWNAWRWLLTTKI